MDINTKIEEAVTKAKTTVLEEELQRVMKENEDLRKQLASQIIYQTTAPAKPSREEQMKVTLSNNLIDTIKLVMEADIAPLMAAKEEFSIVVDELRGEIATLRKQFEFELKFNNFLYCHSPDYRDSIMKHKNFFIDRMLETTVEFRQYLCVIKYEAFTIHVYYHTNDGLTANDVRFTNGRFWQQPRRSCPAAITRWDEFIAACKYWAEHTSANHTARDDFQEELIRRKLL